MPSILIACSTEGTDTVAELPYVLWRAGYEVTLFCLRWQRRRMSCYYHHWLEAPTDESVVIADLAEILRRNPMAYDWIILGDDLLLRALLDSDIEADIKQRLSPIGNTTHLDLMGSKISTGHYCSALSITTPPYKICNNLDEAVAAAEALGFPVMIKKDRSGGGAGVFKCQNVDDVKHHHAQFGQQMVLVEKYIDGALINVEPLFMHGKLLAYAYSETVLSLGAWGVSTRRHFKPCPQLAPLLERLGHNLNLTCFANLSFIRAHENGEHYLIEMDLRPNAWAAIARFAGIDFAAALADPQHSWRKNNRNAIEKTLALFHREVPHKLDGNNGAVLRDWVYNRHGFWRLLPWHDVRLFLFQIIRALPWLRRYILGKLVYNLQKFLGRLAFWRGSPHETAEDYRPSV